MLCCHLLIIARWHAEAVVVPPSASTCRLDIEQENTAQIRVEVLVSGVQGGPGCCALLLDLAFTESDVYLLSYIRAEHASCECPYNDSSLDI